MEPFRTTKRQQICAMWTPASRVHLIVGSSEHNQLGKKLPALNRGEIRLEMPAASLKVFSHSEIVQSRKTQKLKFFSMF